MAKSTPKKMTNLTRMRPNTVECTEAGCTTPRGANRQGFTQKGLTLHKSLKHGIKAAVSETPEKAAVVDYGTPGDEVVMGGIGAPDRNEPMEDIRHVVDTDWEFNEYVTPEISTDEAGEYVRGWRVRGRKQCCDRKLEHNPNPKYHCLGDWVPNPANITDPKTGWRVVDGARMKPVGRRINMRIVDEADKSMPYEPLNESVPVGSADERGAGYVRIKARNERLYVELVDGEWTEYDLDKFFGMIRLAVKLS